MSDLQASVGRVNERASAGGQEGAVGVRPAVPGQAAVGSSQAFSANLDAVMRIPVCVRVVLGTATMPVASLLKLGRGAVIPLERRVGDPVEVVVNDQVIARGEVVVLNEEGSRFGISLTEIAGSQDPGK